MKKPTNSKPYSKQRQILRNVETICLANHMEEHNHDLAAAAVHWPCALNTFRKKLIGHGLWPEGRKRK